MQVLVNQWLLATVASVCLACGADASDVKRSSQEDDVKAARPADESNGSTEGVPEQRGSPQVTSFPTDDGTDSNGSEATYQENSLAIPELPCPPEQSCVAFRLRGDANVDYSCGAAAFHRYEPNKFGIRCDAPNRWAISLSLFDDIGEFRIDPKEVKRNAISVLDDNLVVAADYIVNFEGARVAIETDTNLGAIEGELQASWADHVTVDIRQWPWSGQCKRWNASRCDEGDISGSDCRCLELRSELWQGEMAVAFRFVQ